MKKLISIYLTVILLFCMMPVTAFAEESDNMTLQELEQRIKNSSHAEIKDADGNVLETLEIDIHVQKSLPSRSADGDEYTITCIARAADNDEYSDSDTKDGYIAILTMVCKDVIGRDNLLISVSGSFSGNINETRNRTISYAAYNTSDFEISSREFTNVGLSYLYTPVDYVGYTFRAWGSAEITATGNYLYLYVSTDAI